MKEKLDTLATRELSQKEKIVEWMANILALIMLIGFFLKIVFF